MRLMRVWLYFFSNSSRCHQPCSVTTLNASLALTNQSPRRLASSTHTWVPSQANMTWELRTRRRMTTSWEHEEPLAIVCETQATNTAQSQRRLTVSHHVNLQPKHRENEINFLHSTWSFVIEEKKTIFSFSLFYVFFSTIKQKKNSSTCSNNARHLFYFCVRKQNYSSSVEFYRYHKKPICVCMWLWRNSLSYNHIFFYRFISKTLISTASSNLYHTHSPSIALFTIIHLSWRQLWGMNIRAHWKERRK